MAVYVDLEDFKEYLRIEHKSEDVLIESLLEAASSAAENWCRAVFEEGAVPQEVLLAVKMHAGYHYEHRSEPDEKGYQAMMRAFHDLLAPYVDPDKMF